MAAAGDRRGMRTIDENRSGWPAGATLRDSRGSVATIFAVAMVPVVIAAGIGIDMARATFNRSALQDALDATALAVAHLPANTPQATIDAKAAGWLNANLNNPAMGAITLSSVLTNGQVVLTASTSVPTTLTAIAGYTSVPIAATSTVKWGLGHVEVALVLDNTGSMAGTKLSRLKTAAADLVDTLADSTDSTDANALKIGVVPFAATVKLGSSYKTSTWMAGVQPTAYGADLFNGSTNVNRFTMLDDIDESWGGCVESRPAPYDVQDTAPSSGAPKTMFVPYFAPDEPDDNTVVESVSHGHNNYFSFGNNYLPDEGAANWSWQARQGNKNKYDEDIAGGGGPNAGCGMQSLVRLTTNMTTVKNKITAMNASGNTNIPIGLMWGWHLLSPNLPFSDGAAYTSADTKKFVVLLTDGDNTNDVADNPNKSNYSALGYLWQGRLLNASGVALDENSTAAERTAAMDARMVVACANMKAQGITIYTVRIDVSGTSPAALKSCASSPDKFYDIDSSGLSSAFAQIAGSIGRLRISN
ncbi:MAG TPA: TadE/TadG family type IV pilus assembly protein [Caulobacteraceae bacterium]|jgi:Flp pilus assembly protein TadG|nr:TadE/TadG family type IV pilus assembly protein [Caulobacteraceae bacterium]